MQQSQSLALRLLLVVLVTHAGVLGHSAVAAVAPSQWQIDARKHYCRPISPAAPLPSPASPASVLSCLPLACRLLSSDCRSSKLDANDPAYHSTASYKGTASLWMRCQENISQHCQAER